MDFNISQLSPLLPALLRMSLRFVAQDTVQLPGYAGSAWRGAFGHALREVACSTKARACTGCTLLAGCPYPYVFETPKTSSAEVMRRYATVPHPFVLRLPEAGESTLAAGANYVLEMVLIGRAETHAALIADAFGRAGQQGIGANRGRLRLTEVTSQPVPLASEPSIEAASLLTVELTTPLRMLRNGKLVSPDAFLPGDWLFALAKRISLLGAMHSEATASVDFPMLKAALADLSMTGSQLRWHDWTRFSSRQSRAIEMNGVVGKFSLTMADIEPFLPLLRWGQWGHVGKGTSMGMGGFRITAVTSL